MSAELVSTPVVGADRVQTSGEAAADSPAVGRIDVHPRVVVKIARRAAAEVDNVGAPGRHVLGKAVDRTGSGGLLSKMGLSGADLDALPQAEAQVDGNLCFVKLKLSVRYPAPLKQVTDTVRGHVARRVEHMAGVSVAQVDIDVDALVTAEAPRARVQ